MAIIQVAYDVPPDIALGLLEGTLSRFGSVVRDDKQIIRHLKEVSIPERKVERLSVTEVLAHKKGAVIGTLIVVGGLVITAIALSRNKKNLCDDIPSYVADFKAALGTYSQALKSGTMDEAIIDNLISALDALQKNEDENNISIDFSSSEFSTLVGIVLDYTKKLASVNAFDIDDLAESADTTSYSVIDLRRLLQLQKQVFKHAS